MILWAKTSQKSKKREKWLIWKGFSIKNTILPPWGPIFSKNKVIFEFLVKKYVDIDGPFFVKMTKKDFFDVLFDPKNPHF